jgi:2-polyprenyl-6-methoxyphenol hydroxylase-like FAD-dependent oxidoreductase
MNSAAADAEVVIIGAGPVGKTLAILLAQLGHHVVVLERRDGPYALPRAVHFDHEVGRIFQSCGIGDRLAAITEPAALYEWRNGSGETLLWLGRSAESTAGWPMSSMFSQPALEALLDERHRDLSGVTVRTGVEVNDIESVGERVRVRGGDGTEVRARYVVGCDGADSTVRALSGLTINDLGFHYDWLIVDVVLAEPRVFDPVNVQVCDPARPTTAVSGGPGRRRWEFMRLPHESMAELVEPRMMWELLAPWDVHPGNATVERCAPYSFNARYAERWRAGRVLIAGDAAHLMPPFAGQGLCAGIRDASNLAWKLSHVLGGAAADRLLDTYEEERLNGVRQAIDFSVELGKLICVTDVDEAARRDAEMAPLVGIDPADAPSPPELVSGCIDVDSPGAGEMFVQGMDHGRRADEVYGMGWRLFTLDVDEFALDARVRDWFAALGGTVVSLSGADAVYRRWFGDRGVRVALQRPDFYVYGTAHDMTGAASLLEELRGRLGSPG